MKNTKLSTSTSWLSAALLLTFAAGCGGDHDLAPGTLEITVYGEDYIELGMDADAFDDGWAVSFDRFLVSLGELSVVAGHDTDPGIDDAAFRVFDLVPGSGGQGHRVVQAEVPGGHYDHIGFTLAPAASAVSGNASPADVDAMRDGGYSVLVAGQATRGEEIKTFSWGFDVATVHHHCEAEVHIDGDAGALEITIHGDHLFFDDLVEEEPYVAFQLIADADADEDGEITRAELEALDIRTQERYQTGSLDVATLWDFMEWQVSRIGHVNGEGHCEQVRRP